jgi:hypothetical protein
MSLGRNNAGIMTLVQIESLKSDFLEWSSGFPPDSPARVTVYIDYAISTDGDPVVAREVLLAWMLEDAMANHE